MLPLCDWQKQQGTRDILPFDWLTNHVKCLHTIKTNSFPGFPFKEKSLVWLAMPLQINDEKIKDFMLRNPNSTSSTTMLVQTLYF